MVIYATDMTPPPSPSFSRDSSPTRSPSSKRRSPFALSLLSSSSSSTKHPEPTVPAPTTFPLFTLLPLELRLQIYQEFIQQHPRVLSITSTSTSTLYCTSPHPALLSLNREARLECLKKYYMIKDLEGERGFYYDPFLDTIHLTSNTKFQQSELGTSSTSSPSSSEYLTHLSIITSSLPTRLGIFSLALRGVSTLPPSSTFLASGGNKVREIFMLVGPGAHRRGASSYCGVNVGFMRKMMCREMESALEKMDEAGGFGREGGGAGRVPRCIPLVGGAEGEVQERVLRERGGGRLVL
ncbi:uncharacterized protein RAG0_11019 [Rhynchosporium agropyri]|uniref:2EXR domain-containing protein n=1 Tax=Rhynchosporium agropyri TaxID=914238 RepID=A0A1E1L266_9HELO|nr:uncharacterized protein RAG0_11019 [Rhynchosporium agropyri]